MRKACIVFAAFAIACGGDDAPPLGDTPSVVVDSPQAGTERPVASGWDERAGPVLLVVGDNPGDVVVVYPHLQGESGPDTVDVEDYTGATATLIGRRGVVARVTLVPGRAGGDEDSCQPWPHAALPQGDVQWTVGFVRDSVDAIPVDSLAGFSPRDSARFVASIARLASALPGTRSGERAESFHGLPFVVREAARFMAGDVQTAVAHVVRRVNMEANPLEEHTLLVLERRDGEQWAVVHAQHAVGPEDTVARWELLGAVRLGGAPTLVLAVDGGEGVTYALLQRTGSGAWRQVWRSAQPGC